MPAVASVVHAPHSCAQRCSASQHVLLGSAAAVTDVAMSAAVQHTTITLSTRPFSSWNHSCSSDGGFSSACARKASMPAMNVADDAWRCDSCCASCPDEARACCTQAVVLSQLAKFFEVAMSECRCCWYSGRKQALNGSPLMPSHTHCARAQAA